MKFAVVSDHQYSQFIAWLLLGLMLSTSPLYAEEDLTVTVIVEGLEGELLTNALAFMDINEFNGKPAPVESRVRWLHQRAPDEIRQALQPFGYYQPAIEDSLELEDSEWVARYRVKQGPPLLIDNVDVQVLGEGADDLAYQRRLNKLPFVKDQILIQPRYEAFKQDLQWVATERGYFDAKMAVSEIRVRLEDNKADIKLHFDTGKRYQFGQVHFPDDAFAPEFLRRYLDFQPGDPYNAARLLDLQSDLVSSDYFDQVEVDAPLENAEDYTVPIDVQLIPRKARKYSFGLGYGTDTGVRGKAGVDGRHFNRWGHHYRAELVASQIRYSLGGEYIIPGADPRTDQYSFRASLAAEDSDTKDTQTARIGVSKKKQYETWLSILSLEYLWEQFSFDGSDEETTALLMPSINLSRVSAQDRLFVKRGNRLGLLLRGSYEQLLSDISFVQGALQTKWIWPIGEKGRLVTRADLGSTWASDFDRLPATLRFYAGGDNSVRGYSLDSIGPRDDDDNVVGGKHLLVGSLEYQYYFLDKWGIAAFVDTGDAFDTETPEFKTGVGLGLRWLSPVGPIRVDLASGLDEPGDTVRLHLNIGPDL
ncbi:MAG: autotransporter assembly complex family protein [Candidatus Competibacteraceae bacterium]|jgi:translocation and assembly module TamA|nr:autotransporter assembly complex family protein [Candidatus Competibacteraceae bacterium]